MDDRHRHRLPTPPHRPPRLTATPSSTASRSSTAPQPGRPRHRRSDGHHSRPAAATTNRPPQPTQPNRNRPTTAVTRRYRNVRANPPLGPSNTEMPSELGVPGSRALSARPARQTAIACADHSPARLRIRAHLDTASDAHADADRCASGATRPTPFGSGVPCWFLERGLVGRERGQRRCVAAALISGARALWTEAGSFSVGDGTGRR